MDKVGEFRRRAAECRALAASSALADIRQNYAELAEVWDRLADERLVFFEPPTIAQSGKFTDGTKPQ